MIRQRGVWFPANSCQIDEWLKQSEDLDVARTRIDRVYAWDVDAAG